jgi:hypothetical protein
MGLIKQHFVDSRTVGTVLLHIREEIEKERVHDFAGWGAKVNSVEIPLLLESTSVGEELVSLHLSRAFLGVI